MNTTTTTARATWDSYTSSWKVSTSAERRSLYGASLTADCTYTDPLIDLQGWDALEAYTDQFHSQVPGGHFVTRWFQEHHGRAVAAWDMVTADGTKIGEGISHARYGDDGRLEAMTGFFDTPADA